MLTNHWLLRIHVHVLAVLIRLLMACICLRPSCWDDHSGTHKSEHAAWSYGCFRGRKLPSVFCGTYYYPPSTYKTGAALTTRRSNNQQEEEKRFGRVPKIQEKKNTLLYMLFFSTTVKATFCYCQKAWDCNISWYERQTKGGGGETRQMAELSHTNIMFYMLHML